MRVVRRLQSTTEDPMAGNTGVGLFRRKNVLMPQTASITGWISIIRLFLAFLSGISTQFPVMWQ